MYTAINGWTKEKMKARIMERMLDHPSRSDGVGMNCVYRAPDGNACGAGVFIPDELYDDGMDSVVADTGIKSVACTYPTIIPFLPLSLEGMKDLQKKHDGIERGDPRPEICCWIDLHVKDSVTA